MGYLLRFNGQSYAYAGGTLTAGSTAEFNEADALKLLTQTSPGLWTPADDAAAELVGSSLPTPIAPVAEELAEADESKGVSDESEGDTDDNQCTYIKPDGTRCKAYALSDSNLCFFHARQRKIEADEDELEALADTINDEETDSDEIGPDERIE